MYKRQFCNNNGFPFLPASSKTVEKYMFFHVHTKAMLTLPQFLSAISYFHAKAHLPSPTLSCAVSRALEGAKRSFGKPSVSRKIISLHHLRLFGTHAFSDHVIFVRL